MPADRVVRVVPNVAAVGKTFDYSVPPPLDERVVVGTQVRVSLHGRRVMGWVVEDNADPPAGVTLRAIEAVKGFGPPESVVSLAGWAAWRWAGPVTALLKVASSDRVVTTLPKNAPGEMRSHLGATLPTGLSLDPDVDGRAFAGGTVVVRLPPAEGFLPLALAAARILYRPFGDESSNSVSSGVLMLVPSIDAAARLAGELRSHGAKVALLPGEWPLARAGKCIVVGTRSAAFAPLPHLAAAVVFDAHDEAYHEERAPTWSAWEVVVERARRDGAPCALVSSCPTLEVLEAGPIVVVSRHAERSGWAAIELVDRRNDDPRTGLYSQRVVSLVRWAAEDRSRTVLCVLNRTGRVRLMACAACGEIARCENCSAALELVRGEQGSVMRCRRCGSERPVVCANCGATRMKAIRVGVSKVREELEALAGTPVAEVWGKPPDRAVAKNDTWSSVIVGTEAVLHRSASADAVVFLDFDSELLAPRMRASEEAIGLLARASRLVSQSPPSTQRTNRSPGRVVVQTRVPDHQVLKAAVAADPGRLASEEAAVRRSLGLPPYRALALLSGAAADVYAAALKESASPGVEVTGPADGSWLVKAEDHDQLCNLLASVGRPRGRLRVEVDPVRV